MVSYDPDHIDQAVQDVREGRLGAYISDWTEVQFFSQVGGGKAKHW
jgi:hypothetical protein